MDDSKIIELFYASPEVSNLRGHTTIVCLLFSLFRLSLVKKTHLAATFSYSFRAEGGLSLWEAPLFWCVYIFIFSTKRPPVECLTPKAKGKCGQNHVFLRFAQMKRLVFVGFDGNRRA